jgi:GTP pyrophosphokinase
VRFKVTGNDRKGLLSDISSVIAANKINILSASAMTYPDRSAAGIYEVEIEHMSQLQKVMKSIQKIKGVRSVDRMRSIT